VQVHPAKKDIIFFERNGLRHGEFTLKENHEVLEVQWNADSDTLAILMLDKEKNSSVVQLWTAKNYYWYLKQEYNYQTRVADIKWDAERGLVLHVTTVGKSEITLLGISFLIWSLADDFGICLTV
jgi:elongator complex protein 1